MVLGQYANPSIKITTLHEIDPIMTYTIRNVSMGVVEWLINISPERIEGVQNFGSVICPSLQAIEMSISLHLRHRIISPKFPSWWRRMRKVVDEYG